MKYIPIVVFVAFLLCACSSTPKEQPFTVKLDSPHFDAGSTEMYLDGFMSIGGLKKHDVIVSYFPNEDAVCLQFKIQFIIECNQFWDKAGRDSFLSALEQYKDDYTEKKLGKGSARKNQKTYGSYIGFFAWKKTKVGIQAHSSPRIDLGYALRDKAAFFVTSQQESLYEDPIARSRNQTSSIVRMYFSRSQADALAAMFDEEYLRSLVPSRLNTSPKVDVIDEYTF